MKLRMGQKIVAINFSHPFAVQQRSFANAQDILSYFGAISEKDFIENFDFIDHEPYAA